MKVLVFLMIAMSLLLTGCATEPISAQDWAIRQRAAEDLMNYGIQMQRTQTVVGIGQFGIPGQHYCQTVPNGFGGFVTNCY